MARFQLSAALIGHEADVKAVCWASDDVLLSASRDKTVRVWTRTADNMFEQRRAFTTHSAFVNSLAFMAPSAEYPDGLIVSGGNDRTIYVHALNGANEPIFVLAGHSDNVCALATASGGRLISGSWDKTARVWTAWNCTFVLKGHESSVWSVLAIGANEFLTASADKSVKLWSGDKCMRTFLGHTDVVRHLALSPAGIVSCSNDGTVRLWSREGECVQEMHGHTSFVYQVVVLPSGDLASCGEDCTMRIWKDGNNEQTIMLPATSVWTLSVASDGDVAVGTSDNMIRVFSKATARVADHETMSTYQTTLAEYAIPKTQIGDINKEKLPGLETLNQQGKKDGQVIMVRNGDTVEAHQWSNGDLKWAKVGEVVDAVGSNRKQIYEGKEYDYVFDIDIEDGVPALKLPFNITENPYMTAQKFLDKHKLPQSYIDEVANFIVKNTKGVSLSMGASEYQDPFTGGQRYQGAASSSTENSGGSSITPGVDPFTGQSKYAPGGIKNYESNAFPVTEYVTFRQANVSAIMSKLSQLQEQVELKADLITIDTMSKKLSNPSATITHTEHDALLQILTAWPVQNRFPGIDLLRLVVLVSPAFAGDLSNGLVDTACDFQAMSTGKSTVDANMMLAFRLYANMFVLDKYREIMWQQRPTVIHQLHMLHGSNNKNIRLGLVTVILNYAVYVAKSSSEEVAIELLALIIELMKHEDDAENAYRLVAALGTLLIQYPSIVDVARTLDTSVIVCKVKDLHKEPKVQEAVSAIEKLM